MSTELWHPDIIVDDDIVRKTIEAQFKELAPIELKFISEGWDNKIYLVNRNLIFRFPRRKIAANLIERENAILKYLPDIVNLKVPTPTYLGEPTPEYPYTFHGYPIIKGKSGCHAKLTESERVNSIEKLALFLKSIHNISASQAKSMGAKTPVEDRTDVDKAIKRLNERVKKIQLKNIMPIDNKVFEEELLLAKSVKLPTLKVLIHGDLYFRHLIFYKGELTGIIDWGDVALNNKTVDLAVIFSFYPEYCHQRFFDVYGEVDNQTWTYARFLGLYTAITILLYGSDIGDKLLVHEALDTINRINPKLLEN